MEVETTSRQMMVQYIYLIYTICFFLFSPSGTLYCQLIVLFIYLTTLLNKLYIYNNNQMGKTGNVNSIYCTVIIIYVAH